MCSAGAPPAGAANVPATRPAATVKQACRGGGGEPDNQGFRWIGFWNVTLAGLPGASIRVGMWRNGGTPQRSFTFGSFCQNKRKHQRCEVTVVRCHEEWLRTPLSARRKHSGRFFELLKIFQRLRSLRLQMHQLCFVVFLSFSGCEGSSCADCPPDLRLLLFTTL